MNPARGIALKLLSVVIFMAMWICIKVVAEHLPAGEIVFFRSLFAIPVILVWLVHARRLRDGLRTANPLGHLWRGLLGVAAMGFSFTALGLLPLPEVTAIGYANPVLVTIFAAMFLGEVVRAYRVGAVLLGLAGVLVVLAPRLGLDSFAGAGSTAAVGAMAALIAAVASALAEIFIRRLTRTETTACIVFWFSVTSTVLSLLTIPFGWVWPTGTQMALLAGVGLLGGLGQIAKTSAYRYADASLIAPFQYSSMILAVAAGYFPLRRGADAGHAGRRGAGGARRADHRLARTPARARTRPGAQGDDAAGLTRCPGAKRVRLARNRSTESDPGCVARRA